MGRECISMWHGPNLTYGVGDICRETTAFPVSAERARRASPRWIEMCQTSVVLERDGKQEQIMENVTSLEVLADGVRICTLFEEPRQLVAVRLEKIDFLSGIVTLVSE